MSELAEFYRTSLTYRDCLARHDRAYLRRYVEMVARWAPRGTALLDLGCGNGLSSRMLAERGFCVTGADISPLFLENAPGGVSLRYRVADAEELPFHDGHFDVVAANELLEHLPNVPAALSEINRVLRPGGLVLLRGPNLRSPITPLLDLIRGRPRAPFNRTRREAAARFLANCRAYAARRFRQSPTFEYREPDLRIIGGDGDACYEACTLDVLQWFRASGYRVLAAHAPHETRGSRLQSRAPGLARNMALVVKKPCP